MTRCPEPGDCRTHPHAVDPKHVKPVTERVTGGVVWKFAPPPLAAMQRFLDAGRPGAARLLGEIWFDEEIRRAHVARRALRQPSVGAIVAAILCTAALAVLATCAISQVVQK